MILVIKNDNLAYINTPVQNGNDNVGAYCNTPLRMETNKFKSPKNNLGSIIRGLKSTICKQIKPILCNGLPVFQRNYYEHIIRNEKEYLTIKKYIKSNPEMWYRDRNNFSKTPP